MTNEKICVWMCRLLQWNYIFIIIGKTMIIITFLICATVFVITLLKINAQKEQNKAKLEEANEIRNLCCCNQCEFRKETIPDKKEENRNDKTE